ncbi:hypothetical protein [Paenibacillus sp. sgz302251]|uniref:hypothetical protein n=1 Tax=Paenibacillus sp. sgz302251 TaxID=3414493 RepID=UPI003C7D8C7E
MTIERNREERQPHSLATEKDIDPEFGLFTEEQPVKAVKDAEDLLREQYPYEAAAAHELRDSVAMAELEQSEETPQRLPDVPDADTMLGSDNVDPAAPKEVFHGTDLLNGVGHHPEQEN